MNIGISASMCLFVLFNWVFCFVIVCFILFCFCPFPIFYYIILLLICRCLFVFKEREKVWSWIGAEVGRISEELGERKP